MRRILTKSNMAVGLFILFTIFLSKKLGLDDLPLSWARSDKLVRFESKLGSLSVVQESYRGQDEVDKIVGQVNELIDDKIIVQNCSKVDHFVMVKTEKTGSSTLFTILARYIIINELNVMVMTKGGHLDVTRRRGEYPGWDVGPRRYKMADALINHARYNSTLFSQVLHPDTKYITLVREAAPWFASAIKFWPGQVKFQSPDEVLATESLLYLQRSVLGDHYNGQKTIFHLSQLQWLGFDYNLRHNMSEIRKYIKYIVPRFDNGFITDQFDASLIRMRREFCWEHSDLFYKPQEVGGRKTQTLKSSSPLSHEGRAKLLSAEVNLGEQLLYEEFNRTWWSKPDVADPDFWAEVKQFQDSNTLALQKCVDVLETNELFKIEANKWSGSVVLTPFLCQMIGYDNYKLIKVLALYAIGRKYNI